MSRREGINKQAEEAKRVQNRLREMLVLNGIKHADFVSRANRETGIDRRTTWAYLKGQRRVVQKEVVSKFEQLLDCKPWALFDTEPLTDKCVEDENSGVSVSPSGFSTMVDKARCQFLSGSDLKEYTEWELLAYSSEIAGYEATFGMESFVTYPRGIIGLYDDKLLSGFELWPLKDKGVQLLQSGDFEDEVEFMPKYLDPEGGHDWYIASIVKNPAIKNRMLGCRTAQLALQFWVEHNLDHIKWPARLWAMPIHATIELLCEEIGFSEVAKQKRDYPIYALELSDSEAARQWVDRIVRQRLFSFLRRLLGSS